MTDENPFNIPIYKMGGDITVSNEWLIDHGYMEAPPPTKEEQRRYVWYHGRLDIAFALASPLQWIERGSGWLHIRVVNFLLWALRLNDRVVDAREESAADLD